MASKTFTAGTVIDSAWLNDVNNATYSSSGIYAPAVTGGATTTVKSRLQKEIYLDDFTGVDPTGAADSTAGIQLAFNYAMSTGAQINGSAGATYKVSSKLTITSGNFYLDGKGCRFNNQISNATAADPMFEISVTNSNNVNLKNIRVIGLTTNGHTISLIGAGLSSSPEFITIENFWVQGSSGNGKTSTGTAMAAQFFYSFGGMSVKLKNCTTYQSGGIFCNQTLKILIDNCTIDSPPVGALATFNTCNNVTITNDCVFNGGVSDQLVVTNFQGLNVRGNRFKGSAGRHAAITGPGGGFSWENNQHEVYSATTNCVEVTTSVVSPCIANNVFSVINNGPTNFTGAIIALVDHSGGGFLGYSPVVEGNSLIVNSSLTIANFILLNSTLNSWRLPRISNNSTTVSGQGGTGYTVTTGINLSGNGRGAIVQQNQIGANSGNTLTTGISVGASWTGTRLIENNNSGNTTTFVSDSGIKTTRIEDGVPVSVAYTPVVSGATTAGAGTYTTQTGTYSIVDGRLKFDFNITWTAHTGTGQIVVSLPFSTANKIQVVEVGSENLTFTGQLTAIVSAGANNLRIWVQATGAPLAAVAMDTAATLYLSGVIDL